MFSPDGTLISASTAPHCGAMSVPVLKINTFSPTSQLRKIRVELRAGVKNWEWSEALSDVSRAQPKKKKGKKVGYDTNSQNTENAAEQLLLLLWALNEWQLLLLSGLQRDWGKGHRNGNNPRPYLTRVWRANLKMAEIGLHPIHQSLISIPTRFAVSE